MIRPAPRPILVMNRNGTPLFFLRKPGSAHEGEYLSYDDYIVRWEQLHPQAGLPRCADPRCNEPFESNRADQRFCSADCGNRYRNRMTYRQQNNLPDDDPVAKPDAMSNAKREMLELLELAKRQFELTPPPNTMPEMIPGTNVARMASATKRDMDQRELITNKYSRLAWDLRRRGFESEDMSRDGYNALIKWWSEHAERLPTDEELMSTYVDFVKYQYRLAAIKYKASLRQAELEEAQEIYRKQCPVTMDEAAKEDK